jgi:hypothetical protein
VARAAVPRLSRPGRAASPGDHGRRPDPLSVGGRSILAAAGIVAYLTALLAADHFASRDGQLGLGLLTWIILAALLVRLPSVRVAQVVGVVAFATVAEFTGSILWGVYRYRLHNLPLFIPPAHGLVFLAGASLSAALARFERLLALAAAVAASGWALLGLTVLGRTDLAGALGVPLLLVFLVRSRNRGLYACVFFLVAGLEFYGTAIGTWRWAPVLPGLGIPDGNPPSGVASGYVWFDVMALTTAPILLALARRLRVLRPAQAAGGSAPGRPRFRTGS